MAVEIYRASLTLKEHTYFASREIGIFYESEPLIGNYALAYALGLCAAPYNWSGPPRYKQDLNPLNEKGLYVTPATFEPGKLHYAISQFNAQTDSYYFRFDQNAIASNPDKKSRAANFPQSGKIRMLGMESQAYFFLVSQKGIELNLPNYIRLGKFNSKARIVWEKLVLKSEQPVRSEDVALDFLLNAVDLPSDIIANMRAFSVYNIHPAPLLSRCHLSGSFWHCRSRASQDIYLPTGMRFGVDVIQ
jgi:CRISPR-associated protein Csc1